jgi:hypothetical protein
VTELPDEADAALAIDGDRGSASGMMDNLQIGDVPVGQSNRLDVDTDHAAREHGTHSFDTHVT